MPEERQIKNYRGIKCLNCNHPLDVSDKFCPNCGQNNSIKRLSIKDFVDEFLANFYAYDSKIKRTVVSLFTKPGKAAREFTQGKKQFYANPFRFYLSVSLVFFILSGIIQKFSDQTIVDLDQSKVYDSTPIDSLKNNFEEALNDSIAPSQAGQNIKDSIFSKKPKLYSEKELQAYSFFKRNALKIKTYSNFLDISKTTYPPKILDTLKHDNTKWNRYLLKKTYQFSKIMISDKNGKLGITDYFKFLEDKIPFILFVSLPFLTIVFAFIYFRKKLYYAEHMVLVFNLMTFLFLLLLFDEIINLFINFDLSGLILLGYPFYFYKALRNFYQQSRWKTILKFVILTFLLPITASFVALFVIFVGFLFY